MVKKSLPKGLPEHFCFKPWNEVYSHFDTIGPCCVNYKLYKGNIDSYLNSKELFNLRREFLQGDKPVSCQECWKTEESGMKSIRQLDFNYSKRLHRFSVSLSNKCNFKCVMCNPEDSSAWSKDSAACEVRGMKPFTALSDYKLVDYIIEIAKTQNILFSVMGGEPLICDDYIYFLEQVEKFNLYENIRLAITTNLSVLIYKGFDHLEHFSRFKVIDIYASFDGTGSVGEYIRYGFSHKKFEENLIKAQNYVNFFSTTVQVYNLFELPNIFQYAKKFNISVNLCFLTDPDFLSINILSRHERDKVLQYYKKINFKNDDVIKVLSNSKYVDKKSEFKIYTESLDLLWNRNYLNYIPELVEIETDERY